MAEAVLVNMFSIDLSSGVPVYKQLIHQICGMIGNGVLDGGSQLPTIRELTDNLNLNPNTVAKAYRELELRGVISSRRGCGSFVRGNINFPELSEAEKQAKLEALYSNMVNEAAASGISVAEINKYLKGMEK
ncbi:MAG: GntR family transcriptional regulator [Victivallaceae bacterium]|nr:GntR family transcriptional regulator [Victivallaceae bacterium]